MKNLFLLILISLLIACNDLPKDAKNTRKTVVENHIETKAQKKSLEDEFVAFKKALNKEFSTKKTSPLTDEDFAKFKSLAFFSFDKNLVVKAQVEHTPDADFISFPTTTNRLPDYRQYALLHFVLDDKSYTLPIYQSEELMQKEGFEDYLFLPFSDLTNDNETYGGGRYIDTKIPKGDTLVINFNYAYNPYCAYNHKYSCPKIPAANDLSIAIRAGVKKFH